MTRGRLSLYGVSVSIGFRVSVACERCRVVDRQRCRAEGAAGEVLLIGAEREQRSEESDVPLHDSLASARIIAGAGVESCTGAGRPSADDRGKKDKGLRGRRGMFRLTAAGGGIGAASRRSIGDKVRDLQAGKMGDERAASPSSMIV